jgi:hypothetical protein
MKTVSRLCLKGGIVLILSSFTLHGKNQAESFSPDNNPAVLPVTIKPSEATILRSRVLEARSYSMEKRFSTRYCFLVDMSIPSGKKRFFVYDFSTNRIVYSGLVSHGSGGINYSSQPKFSNDPGSDCSSLGKYKVGGVYYGQYGKSYKLYGLETSNSNAYKRAVVLHGYTCVPDEETYPKGVCNSSGCTGVSLNFFNKLAMVIDESQKPILLWIFQ